MRGFRSFFRTNLIGQINIFEFQGVSHFYESDKKKLFLANVTVNVIILFNGV